MGWRERFGADDERAQIAARARALLDAASARPSPGAPPPELSGVEQAAAPPALPPPRGGWVPSGAALGDLPEAWPPPVGNRARHAVVADDLEDPVDAAALPALLPVDLPHHTGSLSGVAPSWRDRVRFEPGRRGLVAVAAVVVVIGSVAGGVLFRGGQSSAVTLAAASGAAAPSAAPAAPVASGSSAAPTSASSSPTPTGSPSGTVTVDVAGLVLRPGVYTLPAGSRVEDALREAGGAKPGTDLSTLNRARVLADGEQLSVGVPGAAPAGAGTGVAVGTAGPGAPVNLNTAGLADLDTLPGVGPVLAKAILDWRTDHGRFSSVDDLQQVTGIGPSRFADLKDLVTV